MGHTATRASRRWLCLLIASAALLAKKPAHATCIQLPNFACEIIPTYGDCKSPEANVWSPGMPFTYRIGCEGDGLQSPDLLLEGKVLKAKSEPLRTCDQWSLWALEDPLPEGAALALSAAGATKPLPMTLAIVEEAAKRPRIDREPQRDFVCNAPPRSEGPEPPTPPPPAGCAACALAPPTQTSWSPVSSQLIGIAALLTRRARRALKPRRA